MRSLIGPHRAAYWGGELQPRTVGGREVRAGGGRGKEGERGLLCPDLGKGKVVARFRL